MSDNKPLIPNSDNDKNNFYQVVGPYVNETVNQGRFKTPTSILASFNSNYDLWGPNWLKLQDDTQCTKSVIELKKSLEILLDQSIDQIYNEIPTSVLTANDKAIFLIFQRKTASAAVVSAIAPGLVLDSFGHLWAKVLFVNSLTPTSKLAPLNNFVYYETFIGAAGIADADIVFGNGNILTTANHTFNFSDAQVGQTLYIHCYYQIKRGDRSPASIIIKLVIN